MMRWLIPICAAACWAAAPLASAQLGGLQLPEIPSVGGVLERVPDTDAATDADVLRQARELRVQDLLRRHRRELERGPDGQAIVRSQIIALAPSAQALARAQADGFVVVRRDSLDGAADLVTLRAPARWSTARALRRLREADPQGVYDFDHLYLESGMSLFVAQSTTSTSMRAPRIGLIDGGVGDQANWRGAVAAQRAFASAVPAPSAHGRAVASILLSAAPGARLYAADIYGGAPTGGASSALARALAWLAQERTPVINISLVGPRNRIVEAMVARLVAAGHVLVAAVGNDGPAAAPLYPAAYPGVVGVTGVDSRGRVLVEAGRGSHVDFAALGVLDLGANGGRVRGTSFAAPIVAGAIATRIDLAARADAERALSSLLGAARDLGRRGRDDVYGHGLIEIGQLAAR